MQVDRSQYIRPQVNKSYCDRFSRLTTRRLSIKGKEGDDAVICTANKTYALRTVHVSNSMIVATGSGSSASQLILGDEIHEIMEMLPSVPKLERLNALLKGSEYGEDFRGVMSEEIPKSLKWVDSQLLLAFYHALS